MLAADKVRTYLEVRDEHTSSDVSCCFCNIPKFLMQIMHGSIQTCLTLGHIQLVVSYLRAP